MQINLSEVVTNFAQASGQQQTASERKLQAEDIAEAVVSVLKLNDRAFVTGLTVWATNPN